MTTMNRIDSLYDGARDLATMVGSNVKHAGKWLDVKHAGKFLDAGAKLGALKGGARVATTLAKRHPVLLAATAAGAGLLWYAAHRRAKRAQEGDHAAIEGSARRVDARRANGSKKTTRAAKPRSNSRSRASATT
jgi:hypothetical protein